MQSSFSTSGCRQPAGAVALPETDAELDAAFEAYADQVAAYSCEWWKRDVDPQRARLAAVPALGEELRRIRGQVQTVAVYRDADGWDDSRQDWQRRLLSEAAPPAGEARRPRVPPLCFFTLGLPGSGKTLVLRRIAAEYLRKRTEGADTLVCDADDLRERFPEYADGMGSEIVQDELQRLAYGDDLDPLGPVGPSLQDRVMETELGTAALIIDVIGTPSYTPAAVERLHSAGWEMHVLLADISPVEAERRAKRRALTSGRIVPPSVIRDAVGRPQRTLEACLATGAVAGYAVVDTGGPPDTPPVVVLADADETYGRQSEAVRYW